ALDAGRHPGAVVGGVEHPSGEVGRVLRVHHGEPGGQAVAADVAADRGRGSATARAHDDPPGRGHALPGEPFEEHLGDVVVGGAGGHGAGPVAEVVHVVAAL